MMADKLGSWGRGLALAAMLSACAEHDSPHYSQPQTVPSAANTLEEETTAQIKALLDDSACSGVIGFSSDELNTYFERPIISTEASSRDIKSAEYNYQDPAYKIVQRVNQNGSINLAISEKMLGRELCTNGQRQDFVVGFGPRADKERQLIRDVEEDLMRSAKSHLSRLTETKSDSLD